MMKVVKTDSIVPVSERYTSVFEGMNIEFVQIPCDTEDDLIRRLDYYQDHSLLDLRRMRSVPYEDENGNRADMNDIINEALTIDESQPSESLPFDNGREVHDRDFWTPMDPHVIVYGFGFLFLPKQDGLHETHMNQGNPANGGHARENGAFQDGAVMIQRGDDFVALFTAFQTQELPTNALGQPEPDAKPLPDFIRS